MYVTFITLSFFPQYSHKYLLHAKEYIIQYQYVKDLQKFSYLYYFITQVISGNCKIKILSACEKLTRPGNVL